MSNQLYVSGKDALIKKAINLLTDDVRMVLMDSTYAVNLATHANLSDIAGGKRVAFDVALTGRAESNGQLTAANIVFPSLSGSDVYFAAMYLHTGTESTSTLIGYWDSFAGAPFHPTGLDLTIQWPSGYVMRLP